MNKTDFVELIKETDVFKQFPKFKQQLTLSKKNIEDLMQLYDQAERYGIGYLMQKPHLQSSTVKLIGIMLIASKNK